MGASLTVGLFQSAEAKAVLIARKHAVLTPDDAGHEVALLVGVGHPLTVDDRLRLCRQVFPHLVHAAFNFADFIEGYGCSGVAFHAAGTVTDIEVATELFGQQVGGNQNAADL